MPTLAEALHKALAEALKRIEDSKRKREGAHMALTKADIQNIAAAQVDGRNAHIREAIEAAECPECGDYNIKEETSENIRLGLVDILTMYVGNMVVSNISTGLTINDEEIVCSFAEARALLRVFIRRDREDFSEELKLVREGAKATA